MIVLAEEKKQEIVVCKDGKNIVGTEIANCNKIVITDNNFLTKEEAELFRKLFFKATERQIVSLLDELSLDLLGEYVAYVNSVQGNAWIIKDDVQKIQASKKIRRLLIK